VTAPGQKAEAKKKETDKARKERGNAPFLSF
jgi:hypothetical protein